jgi:hypothetical protein
MATSLDRFLLVHSTVRANAPWHRRASPALALQSLSLVIDDADDRATRLRDAEVAFHQATPWWSTMSGPLGDAVAARALARGEDPARFAQRVRAIQGLFKQWRLPRVGWMPPLAASWLAFHDDAEVTAALPRTRAILAAWKVDHPWLTGGDDLLSAVLHAVRGAHPDRVGRMVEDRYQSLRGVGLWRGQSLQRAAQLAALQPKLSPERLAERTRALRIAFRARGFRVDVQRYTPATMLALLDRRPEALADEVIDTRVRLKTAKVPWGHRFDLAACLVSNDHSADLGEALQGACLAQFVAVLQAQAAAAGAAAAS